MAELKYCPFCGSEAFIALDRDGEMYKEWFIVRCDNCGAEIKSPRKFMCDREAKNDMEVEYIVSKLVDKWNTRNTAERGTEWQNG